MNEKIRFAEQAISDTREIIKSMDFKIAALLTANLIPISKIGEIYTSFSHLTSSENLLVSVASIASSSFFVAFWVLALYTITKSITALDNPSLHIVNSQKYSGTYYSGGLYNLKLLDAFFNRSELRAKTDVDHHVERYPGSEKDILDELCFEHLKLCYIRDLKIFRFNQSVKISYVWATLGISMYIFSKLSQ